MYFSELLSVVFVSALWGITNPFIRAASKTISYSELESEHRTTRLVKKVWRIVLGWRFWLPLALNLCGSVFFVVLLANQPITFVVPMVNSLTFLFTALFGRTMGEDVTSRKLLLGSTLIFDGYCNFMYGTMRSRTTLSSCSLNESEHFLSLVPQAFLPKPFNDSNHFTSTLI